MSQAIFSRKELCHEVTNAVVTDALNFFVFTWEWLILFPVRFGCDITATKDGTTDSRKKALVALPKEVMSSRINKAFIELISLPTYRISHLTAPTVICFHLRCHPCQMREFKDNQCGSCALFKVHYNKQVSTLQSCITIAQAYDERYLQAVGAPCMIDVADRSSV